MIVGATPAVLGIDSMRSVLQAIVDGVVLGSNYALIGVAFALILGVTRRFHFAFSLCYTVSAYLAAVFIESLGVSLVLAALGGLAVSVALACAIELFVYRSIDARAGDNSLLGIFVAGMGLAIAGENLLRYIWGNNAKVVSGTPRKSIAVGGVDITSVELAQIVAAVVIILGLAWTLDRTLFGQRIKAVRGNPDMAEAVGVDITRIFLAVFAVGTAVAGVAALFDSVKFSATPDMGNTPVFYAFVVAFVAGVDRSPVIVGLVGLAFGVVARLSTLWVSENLSSLAVFGLLCIWLTARVFPRAVRQLSGGLIASRGPQGQNRALASRMEV